MSGGRAAPAYRTRRARSLPPVRAVAGCASWWNTRRMAMTSSAVDGLVGAIVARDLPRAASLIDPDIDFRAMTPRRIWEAEDPAGVEDVLRAWLADPEEEITAVEPTEPLRVEDTLRVGWRVHGRDREGPFVYEQQAYAREQDGLIVWLRVMCTGQRRPG